MFERILCFLGVHEFNQGIIDNCFNIKTNEFEKCKSYISCSCHKGIGMFWRCSICKKSECSCNKCKGAN